MAVLGLAKARSANHANVILLDLLFLNELTQDYIKVNLKYRVEVITSLASERIVKSLEDK